MKGFASSTTTVTRPTASVRVPPGTINNDRVVATLILAVALRFMGFRSPIPKASLAVRTFGHIVTRGFIVDPCTVVGFIAERLEFTTKVAQKDITDEMSGPVVFAPQYPFVVIPPPSGRAARGDKGRGKGLQFAPQGAKVQRGLQEGVKGPLLPHHTLFLSPLPTYKSVSEVEADLLNYSGLRGCTIQVNARVDGETCRGTAFLFFETNLAGRTLYEYHSSGPVPIPLICTEEIAPFIQRCVKKGGPAHRLEYVPRDASPDQPPRGRPRSRQPSRGVGKGGGQGGSAGRHRSRSNGGAGRGMGRAESPLHLPVPLRRCQLCILVVVTLFPSIPNM
jgi:hypothetical protein